MTTIGLIHGGGDSGSNWQLVSERLRALGHHPIAVDLPCDDATAGWTEYADSAVRALRGHDGLLLVAHSLGGFTAPIVCERLRVRALVLVAAMVPTPGARASSYWEEAGYVGARFDDDAFYHDVPPERVAMAKRNERSQSDTPLNEPWPLTGWPKVSTHYVLCRDDRVFPAAVTRRIVQERLGIVPDEIDGGHCVYLSRPEELAERLDGYARERISFV